MKTALLLLMLLAAGPAAARPALDGHRRWSCFYGRILSESAWKSMDLAILEAEAFSMPKSTGPIPLAYLSVGEANDTRSFWPSIKDRPWVIESNPEWAGAHRVDLRSEQWQSLVLSTMVPTLLQKGYKGVMLDTLDVAEYFESSAPARFAGSMRAAEDLILAMRAMYPEMLILPNNGLPLLKRVAEAVDGVVVEDLYTLCPTPGAPCVETLPATTAAKERTLQEFRRATGKPVFVFIYSRLGQHGSRQMRRAVRRCLKNGFYPYVATPALDRLGIVAPGPK